MSRLTLVLCSRNDSHGGNSLWRLQTSLNFVAAQAAAIDRLGDIEILVTDWGSPDPLRHALQLSTDAAEVTRFVEVPAGLASERQKDSPFAEVIANNAAIRRASGSFVGRIDQDTLVGRDFLAGFFDLIEASGASGPDLTSSLLFVGRRSIPFRFARESPSFDRVLAFVDKYKTVLPGEGRRQQPWFDAPVGAVILHQDLWREYRGYDERMIYWGFMETDLALRVGARREVVDLEPVIGCDFYHLGHSPRRLRFPHRRKNPRARPHDERPNDDSWGLADVELPLLAPETASIESNGSHPRSTSGRGGTIAMAVAGEILWETAMATFRLVRGPFVGDRVGGDRVS